MRPPRMKLRSKELENRRKSRQLAAANLKLAELNRRLLEGSLHLTEKLGEMEVTGKRLALMNAELAHARGSARRANEAKSLFLANLSHEIRTPLTGILGMIDFTLDSELRPDQKSQLQIARNAGKALVKTINDLLDFARPVAAAQPRMALPRAKSCEPRPGALTVLIAEDDPVIMELMTLLTSRAGHLVLPARDGHEALRVWESERPSVVLMDVKMPNLDGLEATRRIREREKEIGGEVPIYGLTAHVMEEDVGRCLLAGMTGHIGKPIDFPDLLAILRRHQTANSVAAPCENGDCLHEQTEKAN
jgi:CheY-like chemotaxis protein